MNPHLLWLLPAALLGAACTTTTTGLDRAQLEECIRSHAPDATGGGGVVEFTFDGVPMVCVSDQAADRMRIISPIKSTQDLSAEEVEATLVANFHSALDGRMQSFGTTYTGGTLVFSPSGLD